MEKSLRDELREEVDDVWAELLEHLPLASGLTDPDRPKVQFAAVTPMSTQQVWRHEHGYSVRHSPLGQ